ncbi:MAG: hypothetical protein J1E40_01600 [Oscillospiraceae bacterium]|nr:hypothetical protein [Oscillospiraceae bacterium]
MRNRFTALALILIAIASAACEGSANEEQTSSEATSSVLSQVSDSSDVSPVSETEAEETEAPADEPETESETTDGSVTEASLTEPEDSCEYEWQHAYAEYINDLDFYQGFYIDDINGDDIPEAVIEVNPFGYTIILYYNDNGLNELELATMSDWGSVSYLADTKQILFCPFHGHTWGTFGNEEYYLYDWTGTEYTVSASIYRESGTFVDTSDRHIEEYGKAYIDGEEVDNDTFEVRLAEFMELEQNNGYFPAVELRDESFESYAKEKLPDYIMRSDDY